MLTALFWFAVGAIVGWSFEQPEVVKQLKEKVMQYFKSNNKEEKDE